MDLGLAMAATWPKNEKKKKNPAWTTYRVYWKHKGNTKKYVFFFFFTQRVWYIRLVWRPYILLSLQFPKLSSSLYPFSSLDCYGHSYTVLTMPALYDMHLCVYVSDFKFTILVSFFLSSEYVKWCCVCHLYDLFYSSAYRGGPGGKYKFFTWWNGVHSHQRISLNSQRSAQQEFCRHLPLAVTWQRRCQQELKCTPAVLQA